MNQNTKDALFLAGGAISIYAVINLGFLALNMVFMGIKTVGL